MSGFAALFARDGAPIQPIGLTGRGLRIVADLRLDNQAELCEQLGGAVDERTATDAEIVLAAYERWGEGCPRRLVGDFAFALWDAPRRRLFCARDAMGVRPFYYDLDDRRLVAASTLEAVLDALEPSPAVNEPFLCDLLDWRFDRWTSETPYRGVLRLPPAHWMLVESDRFVLSRYWTFGAEPSPPLRRDEEYVERFREIFLAAVGSRLRGSGPVGFLVSGGLDSSAVACAAHHLTPVSETGLRFYSSVFAETPAAEEREFAEAVARRCPRARMTWIPSDDCWSLRELGGEGGYPQAEPEVDITRALILRPLRQARQDGCRVVLAGIGGDQVLSGEPYHKPFELRDVEARRLLAELPHFRRYSRRTTAGLLLDAWLRPAVPEAVRRLAGRPPRTPRASGPQVMPPLPTLAAQESLRYLTEGTFSAKLAALRIAGDHAGVEVRLPFLDRRVIDFLLAVPARVRFRDGWIKWILRESMRGILPEEVRRRTSLAHFSELQHRGLRDRAKDRVLGLLAGSRVVRSGLASGNELRAAWEAYWSSTDGFAPPHRLTGFLCAESWLRSREEASNPAASGEPASSFSGVRGARDV